MADSQADVSKLIVCRFVENRRKLEEGDVLELHLRELVPRSKFLALLMVRDGRKVGDDYLGIYNDKLEDHYEFSIGEVPEKELLCPRTRDLLRFIAAMLGFDLEPVGAAGHIPDPQKRQCFRLVAQRSY